MSVKYVYVPESPFPWTIVGAALLLAAIIAAVAVAAATDFGPFDDGPVLANFLGDDSATVYVVDNSLSIKDHVAFLAEQVESIGLESKENSKAALILFGSKSYQVLSLDSVHEEDWSAASTQIDASMGETNLFSAARHGVTLLESGNPGVERKLVLITDGETQDALSMPEVVDLANEHDVSIDTIALEDTPYKVMLEALSSSTGGTFYDWEDSYAIAN